MLQVALRHARGKGPAPKESPQTETGDAWIDLVERWSATLTERQLLWGVPRSTMELEAVIGLRGINLRAHFRLKTPSQGGTGALLIQRSTRVQTVGAGFG